LKVPFGNRVALPNEVPWPGRLRAFFTCSLKNLDAGRAREMQTIRPASHTTALGELFIADVWAGVQGEVYEFDSGRPSSQESEGLSKPIANDRAEQHVSRLFRLFGLAMV